MEDVGRRLLSSVASVVDLDAMAQQFEQVVVDLTGLAAMDVSVNVTLLSAGSTLLDLQVGVQAIVCDENNAAITPEEVQLILTSSETVDAFLMVPALTDPSLTVSLVEQTTDVAVLTDIGTCIPLPIKAVSDPHFRVLNGDTFDFNGQSGLPYTLLAQVGSPLYIIARFHTAYTSGIGFHNSQMLPYKPKGTWMVSMAIQVGGTHDDEILLVSCTKQEGYQPLRAGYLRHVSAASGADQLKVSIHDQVWTTVLPVQHVGCV